MLCVCVCMCVCVFFNRTELSLANIIVNQKLKENPPKKTHPCPRLDPITVTLALALATSGFYSLPNPRTGEPTHIINGGMGGTFRTAHFDAATEKLFNVSRVEYHVGGSWGVAGTLVGGQVDRWIGG